MSGFGDAPATQDEDKVETPVDPTKLQPEQKPNEPKTLGGVGFGSTPRLKRRGGGGWGGN